MELSLTFVTYNVLNPFHAIKHKEPNGIRINERGEVESNWDIRKDQLLENMRAIPFDVMALQEISPNTIEFFRHNFLKVYFGEHWSEVDERRHGNAIVVNPETMEVLRDGSIRSMREEFRVAVWVDVFHKESKKVFRAISVHLKGYNGDEKNEAILDQSKTLGYDELKGYLKAIDSLDSSVDGIFIAGDMNEDISEDGKPKSRNNLLREDGFVNDNTITPTEPRTGRCIDYIYYKGIGNISYLDVTLPYPCASDHLLRASKLEL